MKVWANGQGDNQPPTGFISREQAPASTEDSVGPPSRLEGQAHRVRIEEASQGQTPLSRVEGRRGDEASRQGSRDQFRVLFESVPIGIGIADRMGNLMAFNQAILEPGGYSRDDIQRIGNLAALYYDPRRRDEVLALLLQQGFVRNVQAQFKRKDGSPYDALLSLTPTTFNGQACVQALVEDITERKRADEALRENEERFRSVFEKGPLGMITESVSDGTFTRANAVFCEMLGYTEEELKGRSFAEITLPDHRSQDVEAVKRLWEGQIPHYKTEKRFLKKNGETVWGSLTASVIRSTDGKPLYSLAMIEDISERKRAEEEKVRLEAQLRQAQKIESVGRLAGGVAHDFNNMLGVILGHAELALGHVDPAQPLHTDLTHIHTAATRSANLTRQLLAFARKQTAAPKVLDLNDTVASVLTMLRPLVGENIDFRWRPAGDLWPVKIDSSQVDQILTNLCVNARDAIAGVGELTIETGNSTLDETYCSAHVECTPGDYVRLTVSDTGCGMDKEVLSNLFEPFFTTKPLGEGTGLGLATVYGIVKQNNGFIDVASEPEQGSTFTVYLPRHVGTGDQGRTERTAEPLRRGQETILLAEDEPALLELTAMMLERQGYTVLAARTPAEAVRMAGNYAGEIDLLLTDVIMPEMDGRTLAKNLRSSYPRLRCLFASGYTADVLAHDGVLDEGVFFLRKPFSTNELAAKVREALGAPE